MAEVRRQYAQLSRKDLGRLLHDTIKLLTEAAPFASVELKALYNSAKQVDNATLRDTLVDTFNLIGYWDTFQPEKVRRDDFNEQVKCKRFPQAAKNNVLKKISTIQERVTKSIQANRPDASVSMNRK